MSKKNILIILGFILAAVVMVGGFFIFTRLASKYAADPTIPSPVKESDIFDSQYAILTGQVTSVDKNMLTIKNSKGISASFSVSPSVTIYPLLQNSRVASQPTSDLQKIPVNQDVSISLRVEQGQFLIENIAALGEPESPASSSAQTVTPSPQILIVPLPSLKPNGLGN